MSKLTVGQHCTPEQGNCYLSVHCTVLMPPLASSSTSGTIYFSSKVPQYVVPSIGSWLWTAKADQAYHAM